MFEKSKVDVLVVGAGPVGLSAALRLTRAGKTVRIIDRGTHPNQESFALALHPSSIDSLRALGLGEKMIQQGRAIRRAVFFENGEAKASVDLTILDTDYPFAIVLPQSRLETILIDELKKHKINVEWNRELIGLDIREDNATANVAKLAESPQGYAVSDFARVEQGRLNIEAEGVIGADGYRSTVRQLLRIPLKHYRHPRHYVVYEFETNMRLDDELRVDITNSLTSILWPMPDNRCRWSFEVRDTDRRPDVPTPKELEGFLKNRAPWFTDRPQKLRWTSRISFETTHATHFGTATVWLAGDAAHLALPAGVHSMNAGLREAELLANCFLSEKTGKTRQDLFLQYEQERLREWEWLIGPLKTNETTWTAQNKQEIRGALPASGNHLRELLEALQKTSTN